MIKSQSFIDGPNGEKLCVYWVQEDQSHIVGVVTSIGPCIQAQGEVESMLLANSMFTNEVDKL